MKNKTFKIICILLALCIASVGCSVVEKEEEKFLALSLPYYGGSLNPFSFSEYEKNLDKLLNARLITSDYTGAPSNGLAAYETPVFNEAQNTTTYTFTLLDSAKFSNGKAITADDVIFSYLAVCDPLYEGSISFNTLPVQGLKEYIYDDKSYAAALENMRLQAEMAVTETHILKAIEETCRNDIEANSLDAIMAYINFKNDPPKSDESLKLAVTDSYIQFERQNNYDYYIPLAAQSLYDVLENSYIQANLSNGINVTDISGIKKVNDKTVTITIEAIDVEAIWTIASVPIVPMSYYGVTEDGKAQYEKGKISTITEITDSQVGAGAYTFKAYEDNTIVLQSNKSYYKGQPKINSIKIRIMPSSGASEEIKSGVYDIAQVESVQSKDSALSYLYTDNLAYSYIGINANRVPDANIRKAMMHLINKSADVSSYFGDSATILERPLSKSSWAYPKDAEPYYSFDPDKALQYFEAAGYSQVAQNDRLILEKNGDQFKIELAFAGNGIMDHPCAPIISQMKLELAKLGGTLVTTDVTPSQLFDKMDTETWDMWVASWGLTIDPDFYKTFHTDGKLNRYRLHDPALDDLIMRAQNSLDIISRTSVYRVALERVMDNAVVMPVYQRKNIIVFNPEKINADTLPKNMSAFFDFYDDIHNIAFN